MVWKTFDKFGQISENYALVLTFYVLTSGGGDFSTRNSQIRAVISSGLWQNRDVGGFCGRGKVETYVTDIRREVLMAQGMPDPDFRLVGTPTELDQAIIKLAGRVLPKSERIVFFIAYNCRQTPDDILLHIHRLFKKEYTLETLDKYIRDSRKRISDAAGDAKELFEWRMKFFQSHKKN